MTRTSLLAVALGLLPTASGAETYYVDDNGNDAPSNRGTTPASPFRSWARAVGASGCGDTLVVMDGRYTTASHGFLSVSKKCASTAPFTIRAQNERMAFLETDGKKSGVTVTSSSFVNIIGLRVKGTDDSSRGDSVVVVRGSDHVMLRRLLVTHSNRWFNDHLIQLSDSKFCTVEESELYFYHRHGIILHRSSSSVVRRNYCGFRSYPEIGYCGTSGCNGTPDSCALAYPGDDNVFENNVADGPMLKSFSVQALGAGRGNRFLGNISLNATIGISLDVRGTGLSHMPRDTLIRDMVVVGATSTGMRARGSKNTRLEQTTILNAAAGVVIDTVPGANGDGVFSFFGTNNFVQGTGRSRGLVVTNAIQTWLVQAPNAFLNATNYTPATDARWSQARSIDGRMGPCRVWIPDASPLKRAGIDGGDIGANILYRYDSGVLTRTPLWDPVTGEFPHGAVIQGVNDVPGSSAFDVHQRLNVNTNGCPFPAGYGSRSRQPKSPSSLVIR